MDLFSRMAVIAGSLASIGFGLWHFFVPTIWKWYAYIDANATELVTAVRATNIFFSLSLVLFGIMNTLLVSGNRSDRYSLVVVLAATCVLWLTRVALQMALPQGTLYPGLRYGMLAAFIAVAACFGVPLLRILMPRLSP